MSEMYFSSLYFSLSLTVRHLPSLVVVKGVVVLSRSWHACTLSRFFFYITSMISILSTTPCRWSEGRMGRDGGMYFRKTNRYIYNQHVFSKTDVQIYCSSLYLLSSSLRLCARLVTYLAFQRSLLKFLINYIIIVIRMSAYYLTSSQ